MLPGRSVLKSFIIGFICLGFFSVAYAEEGTGAAPPRPDPVIITGRSLAQIKGADISKIRVFAFRGGAWAPIPFQIDERISKGKNDEGRYVFAPEKDPNPAFDDDDELVMLARDFGAKATDGAASIAPKAMVEISAADPNTGALYAYVMVFETPPPASDIDYVSWDKSSRKVVSKTGYEVGYSEKDALFFNRLSIPQANGGSGNNFIDTLKFRANARVIGQLFIYDVTNFMWRNTLDGVIDGPVRVIREVKTRVSSTIFRIHRESVDLVYYPEMFEMYVPAPLGVHKASVFYQADVRISLDLADDAPPMNFFSARNKYSPEIVADGVMSDAEKNLDYNQTKWAALSGEAGTVVMRMDQGGDKPRAYQDLYYFDDQTVKDAPETFPGHRGDFGFSVPRIEKINGNDRYFRLSFVFPKSGQEENLNRAQAVFENQLPVKIAGAQELPKAEYPALADDSKRKTPARPSYKVVSAADRTRAYLPQLLADPNLGYGTGFQVIERKTLGSDLSSDFIFLASNRMYQFYRLEEKYPNLGPISEIKLYSDYLLHPNRFFYGVGNDQVPEDLAVFRQEKFCVRLSLKKDFTKWLESTIEFELTKTNIGHGDMFTTDDPSIEEKFGPDEVIIGKRLGPEVYGLDGGYTNTMEMTLGFDFRDDDKYPTRGIYDIYTFRISPKWLGSDYEYTQHRIDLRYYYSGWPLNLEKSIPDKLMRRNIVGSQVDRVFGIRLVGQRTDAPRIDFAGRSIKDIPFYTMSYFGDANSSRGHYLAQWCDNDVTFAMFEIRWKMYPIVDAKLFYDVGRVWENVNDRAEWKRSDMSDLHSSYGFGFVFNMVADIRMRFDYGFSPENPSGLMYIEGSHTF